MRKLTNYQKEFILEHFFKNEKFSGWKSIAENLLNFGTCIVAGDECIWFGGIGNFIKTQKAEQSFGCLEYKFDLEYLLSSEYFGRYYYSYLNILVARKNEIEKEYQELLNIDETHE